MCSWRRGRKVRAIHMRHYEIVIPLTGTALEKKETTQHLRVCTMLQFKCKVVIRSVFFRFHEKFLMQFEIKKKQV